MSIIKHYHKQDFLAHKDHSALSRLIDDQYAKCLGIAYRYCKSDEQANELSSQCFITTLKNLLAEEEPEEFDENTFVRQFIICIVKTILAQRKGELIADTVIVTSLKRSETNLFSDSDYYKTLSPQDFIHHLRKLNTVQQIIYNLYCIDQFTIKDIANIIQHHELSIKALIERARFNLISSIKSIV
jgi:DNA-directed RNA polymerase specialized sigma24 family protein